MCYICDALAPVCLACEVPDLGEELLGPRVHPSAGFDEADFPEIFGTVIVCKNSSTQTQAAELDVEAAHHRAPPLARSPKPGATSFHRKFRPDRVMY